MVPNSSADPSDAALAHRATVPELLRSQRNRHGDLACVVTPRARLTYAELDTMSSRLAAHLVGVGVGKGTQVAVLFPNGVDWVVAWAAAARVGAVVVPVNTFYRTAELTTFLRHADIQVLVGATGFGPHDYVERLELAAPSLMGADRNNLLLPELPQLRSVLLRGSDVPTWAEAWPVDPGPVPPPRAAVARALEDDVVPADVMFVTYTSGSTGDPKGVVHGHGPLIRHAATLARMAGLDTSSRIWTPMPLCWVGGFVFCLLRALVSGGTLLTQEIFEPGRALEMLERERATVVSAWPAVTKALVDHPHFSRCDLSSVQSGLYEAIPPSRRPPDRGLQIGSLGMSETGGPHTFKTLDEEVRGAPEQYRGTFGHGVPGIEHRIVDPATGCDLPDGEEGEVLVRGDSLMLGFHRRERTETFDADGWYHTGDRGYFRDGWFFFTGRQSDMIKTRGSNVAPTEVEQCLMSDDRVKIAFVVGVPDEADGEKVVALVVPWRGDGEREEAPDVESLRQHVREHLSSYKVPDHIVTISDDQVPMLMSLKIDRRALTLLAERLVITDEG